jgi:hypothetical protein
VVLLARFFALDKNFENFPHKVNHSFIISPRRDFIKEINTSRALDGQCGVPPVVMSSSAQVVPLPKQTFLSPEVGAHRTRSVHNGSIVLRNPSRVSKGQLDPNWAVFAQNSRLAPTRKRKVTRQSFGRSETGLESKCVKQRHRFITFELTVLYVCAGRRGSQLSGVGRTKTDSGW